MHMISYMQQQYEDDQFDQGSNLKSIFEPLNAKQIQTDNWHQELNSNSNKQLQQVKIETKLLPRFTKAIRNTRKSTVDNAEHKFTNFYLINRLVHFKQDTIKFKRVNQFKNQQAKQTHLEKIHNSKPQHKDIYKDLQNPKRLIETYQLSNDARKQLGNVSKIKISQRKKYSTRLASYLRIKSQQSELISSKQSQQIAIAKYKSDYNLPQRYHAMQNSYTKSHNQVKKTQNINKNMLECIQDSKIAVYSTTQIKQNQEKLRAQNRDQPVTRKLIKPPNSIELCKNLNLKYEKIKQQMIVKRHQKNKQNCIPITFADTIRNVRSVNSKYDIPNLIQKSRKIRQEFIYKSKTTVEKVKQAQQKSYKKAVQKYRKYNQLSIQQIIKNSESIRPQRRQAEEEYCESSKQNYAVFLQKIRFQNQSIGNAQPVKARNSTQTAVYDQFRTGKQSSLSGNQIERTFPTLVPRVISLNKLKQKFN